jgi:hypothetical protein
MSSPILFAPVAQDLVVPDESALLEAVRQVKAAAPAFGISRISKELETRCPVSLLIHPCYILYSPQLSSRSICQLQISAQFNSLDALLTILRLLQTWRVSSKRLRTLMKREGLVQTGRAANHATASPNMSPLTSAPAQLEAVEALSTEAADSSTSAAMEIDTTASDPAAAQLSGASASEAAAAAVPPAALAVSGMQVETWGAPPPPSAHHVYADAQLTRMEAEQAYKRCVRTRSGLVTERQARANQFAGQFLFLN